MPDGRDEPATAARDAAVVYFLQRKEVSNMSGNAIEIAADDSDYICETCEEWPECTPRALSRDEEDAVYGDMLEKGFIPADAATATYRDWEKSIRFMLRYGIIRLYDIPAHCDMP